MARPPKSPKTALGVAIRKKRGSIDGGETGEVLGVSQSTISRLELGSEPSAHTALALAKWLGWTVEEVLRAAQESAHDVVNSSN